MSKVIRLISYTTLVLFFVFFFRISTTFAQTDKNYQTQPGIKVTIEDIKSTDQAVSGNLILHNLSFLQYKKLKYSLILLTPGVTKKITYDGSTVLSTSKGSLVASLSQNFNIDSEAEKKIPFVLPFNNSFQSGTYFLTAAVTTVDNSSLGYGSASIPLQTSNNGFQVDSLSCDLTVNGKKYSPGDGPIVIPADTTAFSCVFKNLNTTSSVVIHPAMDYTVRFIADAPKDQIKKTVGTETVTFKPGEEKKVTMKLPIVSVPQVYEGYMYLVNDSNQTISPSSSTRWIVGGASAFIQAASLDQDRYIKGQTIKASVLAYPSMDLAWRGRNSDGKIDTSFQASSVGTDLVGAKLEITVVDQTGKTCASKAVDLPSTVGQTSWPSQITDLTSEHDCNGPAIISNVIYEGQTLASINKDIPIYIQPSMINKSLNAANKNGWLIGGAITVFLIMGGVGYYIWKKNKKTSGSPPTPQLQKPSIPSVPPVGMWFIGALMFGAISSLYHPKMEAFAFNIPPMSIVSQNIEFNEGSNSAIISTDVIKPPINNPLSEPNIVMKRGLFHGDATLRDFYYFNYTNFSQIDSAGSSSITTYPNCGGASLHLVGYASGELICQNKKYGLRYIITIDGQPAVVSNVVSPESSVTVGVAGANTFDVWEYSGIRTADLNVTLAEGIQSGAHNIDVKIVGLGLTDGYHINNFYDTVYQSDETDFVNTKWYKQEPAYYSQFNSSTLNNCNSTGQCYGKLSYQWTCENNNKCNQSCNSDLECEKSVDGCGACLPKPSGGGNVCQPRPACGTNCTKDDQCAGAIKDGCTICLPNKIGTGSVCSKPPACGVSCERDADCAGATKDSCTVCAPNETGEKVCQTPFDEKACKCDGFNAINLKNPANSNFQFESFAKVEGGDVNKAVVKSIQFQMMKSSKSNPSGGTIIASSDLLAPQIVSSDASKVRYRSTWSVTPPAYDANATYRVFAKIKCDSKIASKSATLNGSVLGDIYNSDNNQLVQKELNYSPVKLAQSDNGNLELGTLKDGFFTKITETDACSMVRFEYGQY